ncbi:hypothetical protein BCR36DRAFT_124992 [Piromyces finnis]|uniref:Uncharacterized protein n=1 Tax=Piromyces finnis TaxID=1754191 RepID=A0A1Y1V1W2_9FUNG|nr:hypothetical protein BCR36DRAFT_124992 [Piromyces finnis]|eukprot:ORX44683.1 hypothetical protein BCR36DRAFT_124992 [Piromyces finnis]
MKLQLIIIFCLPLKILAGSFFFFNNPTFFRQSSLFILNYFKLENILIFCSRVKFSIREHSCGQMLFIFNCYLINK